MKDNVIVEKSFSFSVRIVNLCGELCRDRKEYVLSKQLLKSGTSIGANINEAQAAQSRSDFKSKMSIAAKEARETMYWLDLLSATGYIDKNRPDHGALFNEIDSIVRILTSIVKTTQENDCEQ